MCGVFGMINHEVSVEHFTYRLDLLKHRGPDGFGVWESEDNTVKIGHRRLAIIDTTANANQPMVYNDRYILSYNGEVYNYIELRNQLIKEGISFSTHSDSEVLLKLIAHKGPKALNEINGMWAFVLYDKIEKTLLISRDRLGEKPLYYVEDGNKFSFASEMKSLYNSLTYFDYNHDVIRQNIENVNWSLSEETIVKGIKKFPAGYYGILQNGALKLHKYFEPSTLLQEEKKYDNIETAVEEFKYLFQSSCALRMRSDVPLGSSLSGGIDSGLVVTTIANQLINSNSNYRAVVCNFPGSILDESESALRLAQNAKVDVLNVLVDGKIEPNQISSSVYQFEEIAGTSPIPFFQTYQSFRQNNIFVSLDGHGGDELFGGYVSDVSKKMEDDFPNLFKMQKTMQTVDSMYGNKNKIGLGLTWLYFQQELQNRKKDGLSFFDRTNKFKQRLYQSTFEGILPTLLRNYDKYSMQAGVELRMPFLDYRIVEFAFRLPADFKINNGFSKLILRKAGAGLIPSNILNNKTKIGWNSPMGEWLNGIWKEWLLDELNSTEYTNNNLADKTTIKHLVDDFFSKDIKNKTAYQNIGQLIWLHLQPYLIEKANKLHHNFNI